MKNKSKNLISIISIVITMMLVILPATVFAGVESQMTITIRIEGISENLYYDTIQVPYTGENLAVNDALWYLDAQDANIKITGLKDVANNIINSYITDVNGESAGTFGGYDGWSYVVNNISPDVGMDSYNLNEGDSIVLFYGDPFAAAPMQFPEIDDSKIGEGKLKFISKDASFDANWNKTITTNPVVGAKITWQYSETTATYTTDANGEITIDADRLIPGAHTIQIAKKSAESVEGMYLPLVLRFAPDMAVMVTESVETTPAPEPTSVLDDVISQTGAPATHDTFGSPIVITLALVTILLVVARKKGVI